MKTPRAKPDKENSKKPHSGRKRISPRRLPKIKGNSGRALKRHGGEESSEKGQRPSGRRSSSSAALKGKEKLRSRAEKKKFKSDRYKSVQATAKAKKEAGKKPARKREDHLERLQDFKQGIPVAAKFAIFIGALLAIILAVFGLIISSVTEEAVNDQITREGIKLVSMLAYMAEPVWEPPDDLSEYDRKLYATDERKQKRVDQVAAKLKRLVAHKGKSTLLDALILDEKRAGWLASATGKEIKISSERLLEHEEAAHSGVEVIEGETVVEGKVKRVRRFNKPIKYDDRPVAYASIFLSAQKIDEVKESLFSRISTILAVSIFIGVGLTVVLANVLASPIKALAKDMKIVSSGNLDHQTVPKSRDEIGLLAHTFNIMTRNLKVAQQTESERKAMEHELNIATEIQTKLLPERIPQIPGLDIFSYYLSAREVGGDYYDFIVIDPTHLGLVVADVSGKGIPGSMVMTMARSLIRLASHRNTSPADTLRKVNKVLAKDMRRGMFVTALYAVLAIETKELKVCSAGHNPMVYYNHQKGDCELINPNGIALGFDKGPIFDSNLKEQSIQLAPNDRIVAYTDGVVEAMSEEKEEFGDKQFYAIVKKHATLPSKDFINKITGALEEHRGEAEQSDDITITTLKVC
jgi:serine phosphatase RsbU (regulator of sigma subunit)